jgi:hypothetical protein
MVEESGDRITLRLEGEHARSGVSLAAFDSFIAHFISALRYHYRSSRAEPTKKAGRPFSEDQMATAFRLVEFRTGSGVAVLEPPLLDDEPSLTSEIGDVPTLAWANVGELLDAVEAGHPLAGAVAAELEAATRSLGPSGRFSIDYRSQRKARYHLFTAEEVPTLAAAPVLEGPCQQAITGVLHAIDLEPDKVGIRTASGVDWSCRYPGELEHEVLALIGSRVWARGLGRMSSSRVGTLDLEAIQVVPDFEQTELFTGIPVALPDLLEQQGVHGPQGLATFTDPEWSAGEESDLFLEAAFSEVE